MLTTKRLIKFAKASDPERRLLLFSSVTMLVVRSALFIWPLPRVVAILSAVNRRWPRRVGTGLPFSQAALRISQAAKLSGVLTTCLSRTVAAHFLMSRLGYKSVPRIGVSKEGGDFAAHAWLECEQQTVIGNTSPDGRVYTPIQSLERFLA